MSNLAHEFVEWKIYRLGYTLDDKNLRGKPVVFLGWVKHPWDIARAKVRVLGGDEWLVSPQYVIPF